jgi:Protein of unknown function (DUF1440)
MVGSRLQYASFRKGVDGAILPGLRRGRVDGACLRRMQQFVRRNEFPIFFERGESRPGTGSGGHGPFAFGALVGTAYGLASEANPEVARRSGLPLGAAVWLLAEELALPVTGLSDAPDKYPLRDHVNALAAHLAFGSTTEIVRRWSREIFRFDGDATRSIGCSMTKQKKKPPTQQQDTRPEQTDLESDQDTSNIDDQIYAEMAGAETGSNRSPRQVQRAPASRNAEPEVSAHEGSIATRTTKRPVQGITSHSAAEESERQEKVVKDRPDARAGLNHSKK